MASNASAGHAPQRRMLIVKAGTLATRAPALVEKFGDQEDLFIDAGAWPRARVAVASVHDGEAIAGSPEDYGGVLITGSAAMVSAPTPWMETTARWLRDAVAAGVPVLGVCFGHQLLAHALGGRVGPNPRGPEAGTIPVLFNDAAGEDPLFSGLPRRAVFNAHHYETVLDLPTGARVLAGNDNDTHQAVRYGPNAWGVQFHPEMTDAVMRGLLPVVGDALAASGVDVAALAGAIDETPAGPVLLRRFFTMAVGAADPV